MLLFCGMFLFACRTVHATTIPVILGVGRDSVTVRTGNHAGHPVRDAATGKIVQGASNVENYKVDTKTKITLNGLPAKLPQLGGGMRVTVITGMSREYASQIIATVVPPPMPPRIYATRTLASPIDATWIFAAGNGTITVAQRGTGHSNSYKITEHTEVLMNDRPAPRERLRVGMKVIVSAGLDPTTAARVQAYDER